MEQWHSVTVIVKYGGTVEQWCIVTVIVLRVVEQWQSVTVITKCGGAVAQCHSDRKIWWDSGTVVHCNSDSIESGGTVE